MTELERVRDDAQRHISVLTLNLFHERVVDQCMGEMPEGTKLQYCGIAAIDKGQRRTGYKNSGDVSTVDWHVGNWLAAFRFWISREKTSQTVVKVRVNDEDIYVNVNFVDENRSIDAKLPQLGNRSVRDVLKLLEDEPLKKETRKDAGPNPSKK